MSSLIDRASTPGGAGAASGHALENSEIAAMLDRLADLLDIEGANQFRVRAYRTAARTVRDLPQSLAALVAEGTNLAELPGIGRDLAEKLIGVVETGRLPALEEARSRVPPGLADGSSMWNCSAKSSMGNVPAICAVRGPPKRILRMILIGRVILSMRQVHHRRDA